MTIETQDKIVKLYEEGFTAGKIAQKLRIKKALVQEVLGDNAKSSGLGDVVSNITQATGLDVVAEKVAEAAGADDCGCKARAKKLNEIFPFKRMNDLSENNFKYLDQFFTANAGSVKMEVQKVLVAIYNETFNAKRQVSTCSPCVASMVRDLRKVYDAAKN